MLGVEAVLGLALPPSAGSISRLEKKVGCPLIPKAPTFCVSTNIVSLNPGSKGSLLHLCKDTEKLNT